MYKIAVCDDEEIMLKQIIGITERVLRRNYIEFEMNCYNDGYDLIRDINNGVCYDLILLDILMPKINGVDVAKYIQDSCEQADVIFVSSSTDFVFKGYDVGVINYLVKPLKEERIEEVLLANYKKSIENSFFVLKTGDISVKIYYDELEYIESFYKKISFHTENNSYEIYGRLDEYYEHIPKNIFVQCHKSYVVNLEKVKEMKRNCFTTINGNTIPISKAYYNNVKKHFFMFVKD